MLVCGRGGGHTMHSHGLPLGKTSHPASLSLACHLLSYPDQSHGFAEIVLQSLWIQRFPGCVASLIPIDKVTQWVGLLCLTPVSNTEEGVVKGRDIGS